MTAGVGPLRVETSTQVGENVTPADLENPTTRIQIKQIKREDGHRINRNENGMSLKIIG